MSSVALPIIWLLHVVFLFLILAIAWLKTRQLLHPYFVFSAMFAVMISDFIIRGYNDQNFLSIRDDVIVEAQLVILLTFLLTLIAVGLIPVKKIDIRRKASTSLSRNQVFILVLGALFIMLLEIAKRYFSVGGSIVDIISMSLLPRGQKPWELAAYSGNAVFALLNTLLPLSAIVFATLIYFRKGLARVVFVILLFAAIFLLVTNGSRTPVVITFFIFWMIGMLRLKRRSNRVVVTAVIVFLIVVSTSAILSFRGQGFASPNSSDEFAIKYHQDDSYYRAIYAYDVALNSEYRWNGVEYFAVILSNPIPRAIWPGKPLLDQDFYGDFKLYYVTNLYVGELIAIFGNWGMITPSLIAGIFLYLIVKRAYRYCESPIGVPVYLIWCLFVYMCIRSFFNLTFFIYLPLGASLAFAIQHARKRRNRFLSGS